MESGLLVNRFLRVCQDLTERNGHRNQRMESRGMS